jgi:hypothetical protein
MKDKTRNNKTRNNKTRRNKTRKTKVQQRPAHEATPPNGPFWTVPIGPMEIIPIGDNLAPCQVVIRNCGPAIVAVCTGFRQDERHMMPGQIRIISAHHVLSVESREDKPACVELQFLPREK